MRTEDWIVKKLALCTLAAIALLGMALPAHAARKRRAKRVTKKTLKVIKKTKTVYRMACSMTCVQITGGKKSCTKLACKKTRSKTTTTTMKVASPKSPLATTPAKVPNTINLSDDDWAEAKKFVGAIGTCTYLGVKFSIQKGYIVAPNWKGKLDVAVLVKKCDPINGKPEPGFYREKYPNDYVSWRDRKVHIIPPIVRGYTLAKPCVLYIGGKRFLVKKATTKRINQGTSKTHPAAPNNVLKLIKLGYCKAYTKPAGPPKAGHLYTKSPIKLPEFNARNTIVVGPKLPTVPRPYRLDL